MIPTKVNSLDAARFYLGDDVVSGGEIFTDTRLEQPFQTAYRELFRALQGLSNPRVRREAFYDLPINTAVLVPATAGITDLGEVEFVEERGNVTSVAITGVAGTTTVTVTAAGHPFVTGDQAVIYKVGGILTANGMYGVTYGSSSTFVLNGCVGIGTYVSGGTASLSGEQFVPVRPVDRIEGYITASSMLGVYAWMEDTLRFPPCASVRQLRIVYISSASTVVANGDTTGVDDSQDFLAIRTAALAAASRGARDRATELNAIALGPDGRADGSGGILRELVAAGVKALQRMPGRRAAFRNRTNPQFADFL